MKFNLIMFCLIILAACNEKETTDKTVTPEQEQAAEMPAGSNPVNNTGNMPPENYRDEGQCPYEGCMYGEWTVEQTTTIFKEINGSEAAFEVKPGDKISAVTGVVITKELGQVEALKDVELHGEKDLKSQVKKGEIIYVLNYEGEGVYKLWHNGNLVFEQLDPVGSKQNPEYTQEHLLGLKTIKLPVTEWWIKIKNSQGQEGWTNAPKNFGNRDRFG